VLHWWPCLVCCTQDTDGGGFLARQSLVGSVALVNFFGGTALDERAELDVCGVSGQTPTVSWAALLNGTHGGLASEPADLPALNATALSFPNVGQTTAFSRVVMPVSSPLEQRTSNYPPTSCALPSLEAHCIERRHP